MKKFKNSINKALLILIVFVIGISVFGADPIKQEQKKFKLNGLIIEVPEGLMSVQNEILFPVRWLAKEMGATKVRWESEPKELYVEIPAYSEEHRYLSYLQGLENNKSKDVYPLPTRLRGLELPIYPLNSYQNKILHQRPIGIMISDGKFTILFVAYDYEFIDDKLYVSADWFNTMFWAQTQIDKDMISMTYPAQQEIEAKLEEIEKLLRPTTPEEALALWIRGQQVRSGALQYITLSPKLQQKVLDEGRGWVTGGSSPSAGKATIISQKDLGGDTKSYTIKIDEMLQGKISGEIIEEVRIKSYEEQGKTYWLITEVTGDTDYYSILSKSN